MIQAENRKNEPSNHIVLSVFRDHLAARSFKISLAWISWLGLFAGFLLFLTLISGILAGRYYWLAKRADPSRLAALEQEISELRQGREAKTEAETEKKESLSETPADPLDSQSEPVSDPTLGPDTPLENSSFGLFSGFPTQVAALPEGTEVPIKIGGAKVNWAGKQLKVQFNIQYVGSGARGGQQGRIILLARGPNAIFAYPQGAFQPSQKPFLVEPQKGEYFSVSRFRQVKAAFEGVLSRDMVQDVDIYLLSLDGKILIHNQLSVAKGSAASTSTSTSTSTGAPPAPAAAQAQSPAAEASPATASPEPSPVETPNQTGESAQ